MSSTGRRLRENSEAIVKYINQLKGQRQEIGYLVEKQKEEKANLESEMARITYKLNLINKSLAQRIRALELYDATLLQIEVKYKGLADSTQGLLNQVQHESSTLENSIDKCIGTDKECSNCPQCVTVSPRSNRNSRQKTEIQLQGETSPRRSSNAGDSLMKKIELAPQMKTLPAVNENSTGRHPIYERTMEYPMMLVPMIKEEVDVKVPDSQNSQGFLLVRHVSKNEGVADGRGAPDDLMDINNTLIDVSEEVSGSRRDSEGGSEFMDRNEVVKAAAPVNPEILLDSRPTKELRTEKRSTPTELNDLNDLNRNSQLTEETGNSAMSASELSSEMSQTPRLSFDQNNTPSVIHNEYDEVIEESLSINPFGGPPTTPEEYKTEKNKRNIDSLDMFREAYKAQHQSKEPTLTRYKRSINDKKGEK